MLYDKNLQILRYNNGKLSDISRVVILSEYGVIKAGENDLITSACGPFIHFYQNGQVKNIGVLDRPTSYYSPSGYVYTFPVIWSKEFDDKGKIIKTYGKQGDFNLDNEFVSFLRSEKLLVNVNKALSISPKTDVKSISHKKSNPFKQLKKGRERK